MDPEIAFSMLKNIIIAQNRELLRRVVAQYPSRLPSYDAMCNRYITPEYYLPIMQDGPKKSQNAK